MRINASKKFGQCVFRVKNNTVGQFVRAWDITSVTYSLHSDSVDCKVEEELVRRTKREGVASCFVRFLCVLTKVVRMGEDKIFWNAGGRIITFF
jgi:hypothetical protein